MRTIDVIKIENEKFNMYLNKPDVFAKLFPSKRFDFLALNLSNPLLKDKAARQAIASSIDRDEITSSVMQGWAIPACMPVIPGSWIYEEDNNQEDNNNQENDNNQEDDNNPDAIPPGEQTTGLKLPGNITNTRLEILVNNENELRVKVAEKICEYLSGIGIHASIRKESWENVLELVRRKSYDIALLGCEVTNFPDVSYLYSTWYMPYFSSANSTPAYNVAGYNNELVNSYINRIFRENDFDTRKLLFSRIENIINDEVPYIGLYFYLDAVLYDKSIRGELEPHSWYEYNNIVKWYIIKSGD
jgi:peptide/nickel transport system substrate-binding protein